MVRGSGSGAVPRVAPDAVSPSVPVRSALDGVRAADVLAGQWDERRDGAVLVVDRFYAADRRHGRLPIGHIVEQLARGSEALQVLARAWPQHREADSTQPRTVHAAGARSEPRPYTDQLCFFDLETTGLAGGAGTQAFLIGCAQVQDDGIAVRQLLLPGLQHERALLARLTDYTQQASTPTLVTFNGRSFDVPLIETRYLLHRLPFPLADVPHLDVLHPARRLWKQRPTIAGPALDDESCRLAVLERHLAGYHRVGDVPGFEIPSRFFRFIRDGDAFPLEAVLEHNRIDLISLALVTARVLSLISAGPQASTHPREMLGLGRVYERAGRADDAEACYEQAAAFAKRVGREPDVQGDALRRLALCRRRAGRLAEAAAAWQELISIPGCPSLLRREAREAMAIHHEHRSRDLSSARRLVVDVLAENAAPHLRDRAEYRLRRIERKLSVHGEGGLIAALEDAES